MDLNAILQQLTNSTQQNVATQEAGLAAQQQAITKVAGLQDQAIAAAGVVADEAARLAKEQALVDFHRNSTLDQVNATFGVNADEQSYIIAKRMAEYEGAEKARVDARAKYDKASSISLLDDPLGYLVGQLALPQFAAANNQAVSARDAAYEDMQSRFTLVNQAKQLVTVNTADKIKEIKLQEADNNRKAAEVELLKAQADMGSKLAGMQLGALQLVQHIADAKGSLFSKYIQVQEFQMNQERLNLAREEAKARREAAAEAKKDKEDRMANLDAGLALISKFVGAPVTLNSTILKAMPESNKKQALYEAGLKYSIGANLGQALTLLDTVGNDTVLAQQNPGFYKLVRELRQSLRQEEAAIVKNPALASISSNPEKVRAAAVQSLNDKLILTSSNLGSTTTLNSPIYDKVFTPYKPSHKVMLQDPDMANNSFASAVKTVAGINKQRVDIEPNVASDLEDVAWKSLYERVAAGELGPDTAARDIVAYHQKAAKANFDTYQYNMLGLPAQTSTVVTLPASTYFGEPQKVDLQNFAQVNHALVKAAAALNPKHPDNYSPFLGNLATP